MSNIKFTGWCKILSRYSGVAEDPSPWDITKRWLENNDQEFEEKWASLCKNAESKDSGLLDPKNEGIFIPRNVRNDLTIGIAQRARRLDPWTDRL